MTGLLIRLFIKNPEDTGNQRVRADYGSLGSITGIAVNVALSILKFVIGVLSGSLAVTADAANNLADAGGSIVSLFTVRLAQKPVDKRHPFGHGRLEYIGALVVGAMILIMGAQLLKDGVSAIISPEPLSASVGMAALLMLSMLCKLWLHLFYRKLGRAIDSATLLAASKDSLTDVAATGAALVGIALYMAFGWHADGWMGALVALFVIKTGFDVCRDTVARLLGEKPDPENIRRIREGLLRYDGILGVHDLVVHDYGPGRCIASVHAEISVNSDIVAAHELIDRAERELARETGIEICIHMDPIVTDDEVANDARRRISEYLTAIDPGLSLHDFRMVPGESKITLVFDCLLPDGYKDGEKLREKLEDFAQTLDSRYEVMVRMDKGYM